MDYPKFEIADKGAFFTVLVFDSYVIKVPRKTDDGSKRTSRDMADVQNDLAGKMDSVLPCEYVDGAIVMPVPPGVRGDLVDRILIKGKMEKVKKEIISHGYKPGDVTAKNVFYDSENDQLYVIDFHLILKKEGSK